MRMMGNTLFVSQNKVQQVRKPTGELEVRKEVDKSVAKFDGDKKRRCEKGPEVYEF